MKTTDKGLEGGVKDSELWAKSLERCEGDEAKAWEFYYLYQGFLKDLEGGVDRLELWEKTLERCEGDVAKAKELYSLYRNIDLATNKSVNIMFNIKAKLDFYIKYDELDLYFECIAAIEDKGYSLKADGTGGLVIYKSSILLRRKHFIARVTDLKELCKLVEDTNLEELEAQSIADNIKPEEICLFNECTKILEKKGYVVKVDGAHSFTINCLISTSLINLNLVVKARTTSLPELYKLAKECNRTKALRNERYFWAIALSVVTAVLIQNIFITSLVVIIVASFMAFEPESDDISFTVSDKKDEPETDSLHKVTTDTIWSKINRALTTF